jgi:CheY-specific phosphatase CheX
VIPGIKDITSWSAALFESVEDLAEDMLGRAVVVSKAQKQEMPACLLGAFIQVVCAEGPVLLGLTSSTENCENLARLMLGMEPGEPIPELDAFDAIAEMINIIAGSLKTKLASPVGNIELGLPVFLSGKLRAIGRIAVQTHEISIGGFDCELLVFALSGK